MAYIAPISSDSGRRFRPLRDTPGKHILGLPFSNLRAMAVSHLDGARVVLVVDDEPAVLEVMDRTLLNAGYMVRTARAPSPPSYSCTPSIRRLRP
jgi:hypothetical protein